MAEGLEATIEQEKSRLVRPGDCCMIIEFDGQITAITYHQDHEPNGSMEQTAGFRKIVKLAYDGKLKKAIESQWFVPVEERYDQSKPDK